MLCIALTSYIADRKIKRNLKYKHLRYEINIQDLFVKALYFLLNIKI